MDGQPGSAPGHPGIPPRWTSAAKVGVGTSLSAASRVWFTLSHGILNEVYYPRLDQACIRDMGLLVTDGQGFVSQEQRHCDHTVEYVAAGVPAYRLVNTCHQGRYRIEKEIIVDPARDVVLQQTRFVPLQGFLADYHVYVLLAPHLGNQGADNTAWLDDYKGVPMLMAEREGSALALACSAPWLKRSAGFVGVSDGYQDVAQHGQMTWTYDQAENGNVALIGEIDLQTCGGEFVLALAFGRHAFEAGHQARASLQATFDRVRAEYVEEWQDCQRSLLHLGDAEQGQLDYYRISAAVLNIHEAKGFAGGMIASLSIPWGYAKGDNDLGGYHLVWARDLVETVGGHFAAGAKQEARRVLHYLQVTQERDGCWPQNMWLDGTPYWTGIQLDETAFPILLTDMAWRKGLLAPDELSRLWTMVRAAAGFVVRHGPVTQQDRWEENSGYTPFTLAVEIAALLAAADLAEVQAEPELAAYLRETADTWNASIEDWTYATGTELAAQVGVEGYYVRITPADEADVVSPVQGTVTLRNRPPDQSVYPTANIVSVDALALVRFGLRAADDPRIVNTVKVIDHLLKVETPHGPGWLRYNEDGYGEKEDGSAYDGTGIGRAWPLLTGERAHYELAAGRRDEARRLKGVMEAFANEGGMMPEQVWNAPDIPAKELLFGRPSGSAMPLVWAHAEYIKLCRSLHEGAVFDMPPQTVQRYLQRATDSPYAAWRFMARRATLPVGKTFRLEVMAPAQVRWSLDGWQTTQDTATRDTGLGVHVADLPTHDLAPGSRVDFTFYWPEADTWEPTSFSLTAVKPS